MGGHVLYTATDFSSNYVPYCPGLEDAVAEGGLAVCKNCGEYEAGLLSPCLTAHEKEALSILMTTTSHRFRMVETVGLLKKGLAEADSYESNILYITPLGLKVVSDLDL